MNVIKASYSNLHGSNNATDDSGSQQINIKMQLWNMNYKYHLSQAMRQW